MKTRKIISAILAAVMLLSTLVMAVSADVLLIAPAPTKNESTKSIFKQPDSTTAPDDDTAIEEDEKEDLGIFEPYVPAEALPNSIVGGKFVSLDKAGEELANYFKANTYNVQMYVSESRIFAQECYLYSAIPGVVTYNNRTKALTAVDSGRCDVYVFTKGGVPLLRLRVEAMEHFSYDEEDMVDTLTLTPADWNIPEWKFSTLSVTSDGGALYDDISYRIEHGVNRIGVSGAEDKFFTYKEGVAVVRAYRESDSDVYGETVIYSGKYNSAIRSGRWYATKSEVRVKDWAYDVGTALFIVRGWIKTEGGMLIPIVSSMYNSSISRSYNANMYMKNVVASIK